METCNSHRITLSGYDQSQAVMMLIGRSLVIAFTPAKSTFNARESAMITVASEDPDTFEAVMLLDELSNTLRTITGSTGNNSFHANDVRVANSRFAVARDENHNALGCGALRPIDAGVGEIKRMYSRRSVPGIGAAILVFLEAEARRLEYAFLRLETRVVNQNAIAFYKRHGYREIPNFGNYVGKMEAVCFEKRLR